MGSRKRENTLILSDRRGRGGRSKMTRRRNIGENSEEVCRYSNLHSLHSKHGDDVVLGEMLKLLEVSVTGMSEGEVKWIV